MADLSVGVDPIDRGLHALQTGNLEAAEAIFVDVLTEHPDDADALNFLGLCRYKLDRPAEARDALQQAVQVDPQSPDAWYNLAEVQATLKESAAAVAAYRSCTALDAVHPLAWHRLTQLQLDSGQPADAADTAAAGAAARPDDVDLGLWAARLLSENGKPAAALPLLARGLDARPADLNLRLAQYNTAVAAGDGDTATLAIEAAALLAPEDRQVLIARIQRLISSDRLPEALLAAKDFIRIFPDDPEGHFNLAIVFEKQRELGAAAVAYGAVLELNPDHALTYVRLGEVLLNVGHLTDAEMTLKAGIELHHDSAAAHSFLSIVLERIPGRQDEAMVAIEEALKINPNDPFAGHWRATLMSRRGRHADAAAAFKEILDRSPDYPAANMGYGSLLAGQGQIEKGWEHLSKAAADDPVDPAALGGVLFFSNAHPALAPAELFELHQAWAARQRARSAKPFTTWDNDCSDPERRLRIGYLSPDLRSHSVSNFLEPIMSAHDKSKVEVFVLDNTPLSDPVSVHLHRFADRWVRIVGGGSDRVCDIVRELKIDILVDLAGHTSDNRLDVFVRRPAPVQVSYLGYPNTTGLTEIDYRLTDSIVDPPGPADSLHSEKLIRLPGGFLCFNPPAPYTEVGPTPSEWPGITFASFNAVHKINRTVIALWTRVLDAVPGSRMLLKAIGLTDPQTREGLVAAFAEHGVAGDRLVMVERTAGYHEHLKIYHRCDIALDTFPYNGTTTTCEALWMGVPVIALAGDRHSSRVSLSILTHAGLPQLAAQSSDAFVRIATELANDRERLAGLRASLRDTLRGSRLMDGKAHTAAIEAAYRQMWQTWCAAHEPAMEGHSPSRPNI